MGRGFSSVHPSARRGTSPYAAAHSRINLFNAVTPPANGKDGEFHKLEVKSTKAGLKAQARTGYYSGRR
jgi:hypothetical protein